MKYNNLVTKQIKISTRPGCTIQKSFTEAILLAALLETTVQVEHLGITISVTGDDLAQTAVADWYAVRLCK